MFLLVLYSVVPLLRVLLPPVDMLVRIILLVVLILLICDRFSPNQFFSSLTLTASALLCDCVGDFARSRVVRGLSVSNLWRPCGSLGIRTIMASVYGLAALHKLFPITQTEGWGDSKSFRERRLQFKS